MKESAVRALRARAGDLREQGIARVAVCDAAVLVAVDPAVPVSAYGFYAVARRIEAWVGARIPVLDIDLLGAEQQAAMLAEAVDVL